MNAIVVYALLKKMIDPAGDMTTIKTAIAVLQANVSELQTAAGDLRIDVTALQNALEAIQSGFNYKGSVATISALPADPEVGDCYTVTAEDNAEYLWDGEKWIDLGSSITPISKAQINALFQ